MLDVHNLALVTNSVKKVMEATPAVIPSADKLSAARKSVAPLVNNVSSTSAALTDLISNLPFYILNLFFFLYIISLWLLMVRWVGVDCGRRGVPRARRLYYQALVLIFNFPGLLLYFLLRPTMTAEEIRRAEMEEEILSLELEKLRRESVAPTSNNQP
jgi:hypothetical protein